MLTIELLLKIDPQLSELSDAELEDFRAVLYEAAQLSFDVYNPKESGSKNPIWSLTSDKNDDTL